MSKEKRRHHTPEQKLAVLREHLLNRKPISEVCEGHGIAPSVFYEWQRKLFANAAAAFATVGRVTSREHELTALVEQLEAKIARKDTVTAEISEDLVLLKNVMRAREKYPDAKPRIISDNGPQFVAREFKDFIREAGMTHVRTTALRPFSPTARSSGGTRR